MIEARKKIEHRYDILLNIAICTVVTGLFFSNYSYGLNYIFPSISVDSVSFYSKAIILLALVLCLPALFSRFELRMIYLTFGVILVYLIQVLAFRDLQYYFERTFNTFLLTIFPAIICFMAVRNFNSLLKWLLCLSVIISAFVFGTIIIFGNNLFRGQYSMGFSNAMILPTDILLLFVSSKETPKKNRLIYAGLVAGNLFSVFIFGSRGSLIAILAFGLFMVFKSKMGTPIKFLVCAFLLVLCLLLARNFESTMTVVEDALTGQGYHSRTASILVSDIGHDSGRSELWQALLADLNRDIFAIRGINADYNLLGKYSHNYFLELIYDFGPVFGVLFIIFIIYCIIRTVFAPSTPYSMVLTICMFSFFPISLWSGSIWTSMYFWIWIFLFKTKKLNRIDHINRDIATPINTKQLRPVHPFR